MNNALVNHQVLKPLQSVIMFLTFEMLWVSCDRICSEQDKLQTKHSKSKQSLNQMGDTLEYTTDKLYFS